MSDFSKSIAVLPLTNLIPDPNNEYFADSMTEEMISAISKIPGIEVVSRTSAMQYQKFPKLIKDIWRIGRGYGAQRLSIYLKVA